MFGVSALLDHPFMEFEMPSGEKLFLPCGTIPTALTERSKVTFEGVQVVTTITVAIPSAHLSWEVLHPAAEVQETMRAGLMKLNQEAPGPEPLPFRKS